MGELKCSVYNLSDDIPQSVIVYDESVDPLDELKMYRKIIYLLWDRYIRIGAEYEVNISSGKRKSFGLWMKDKEFWINGRNKLFDDMKLFHIFDDCCSICYSFCSNSFIRFKKKTEFQQLSSLIMIE